MNFLVVEGDFPFWRAFVLKQWQRLPHRTLLLTQTPKLWPHDDYDVVVVDTPSPFGERGRFAMPSAPELTREFTVPTILLGAAGGAVLQKMKLKLDWL